MKKWIFTVLAALLLAGCGMTAEVVIPSTTAMPTTETTQPTELATVPTEPVDPLLEQLSAMTIQEKVGQLFIIHPHSIAHATSPEGMAEALMEYPVGGFMLAAKNIKNPAQITEFTAALKAGAIPAFVSVDEEGGKVSRFANNSAFDVPKYKNAAAVGATGDPAAALSMGQTIGAYLAQYGANMDFAPVADVNTNPDNPIIGTRAFSSDARTVTQMTHAMAQGLQSQGIVPVYKHFPGHGDTAQDSHSELAVSYKTMAELEICEWLPYENLSPDVCVMIAHVALPEVTGDMTPASLSNQVVEGILRQKLGFDGVVITDGMEMRAISQNYSSGEAAIKAIEAGCDMILLPKDFKAAYRAVLDAVESGRLSAERIDQSVYRILRLKQTCGLL